MFVKNFQAQQKGMDDKEKEWARQVEQLESEAQRCFEAEELAARYKDELDALQGGKGQQQPQSSTPDQSDDERIRQLEASVQAKENELSQLKVYIYLLRFCPFFFLVLFLVLWLFMVRVRIFYSCILIRHAI